MPFYRKSFQNGAEISALTLKFIEFLIDLTKAEEYYPHMRIRQNVRELVQLEIIRFRAAIMSALFF